MEFFSLKALSIGDVLAITIGVVLAEIIIQMLVTPTIQARKPSAATTPQPAWGI